MNENLPNLEIPIKCGYLSLEPKSTRPIFFSGTKSAHGQKVDAKLTRLAF